MLYYTIAFKSIIIDETCVFVIVYNIYKKMGIIILMQPICFIHHLKTKDNILGSCISAFWGFQHLFYDMSIC